jgi:hypothetical protein
MWRDAGSWREAADERHDSGSAGPEPTVKQNYVDLAYWRGDTELARYPVMVRLFDAE